MIYMSFLLLNPNIYVVNSYLRANLLPLFHLLCVFFELVMIFMWKTKYSIVHISFTYYQSELNPNRQFSCNIISNELIIYLNTWWSIPFSSWQSGQRQEVVKCQHTCPPNTHVIIIQSLCYCRYTILKICRVIHIQIAMWQVSW